ncbi:hypothetical protein SAMN05421676_10234 [Salinibacillus kushneri]|uniref:Uncharacterized protein n=1 Tax=Salinibacillus kushneri TaxID=237682 RepID=A0A1I0A5V8_9BACI|nr:hypothetical protein SAMN05421676_10234 [Salinibacillus kushneri]
MKTLENLFGHIITRAESHAAHIIRFIHLAFNNPRRSIYVLIIVIKLYIRNIFFPIHTLQLTYYVIALPFSIHVQAGIP